MSGLIPYSIGLEPKTSVITLALVRSQKQRPIGSESARSSRWDEFGEIAGQSRLLLNWQLSVYVEAKAIDRYQDIE